MSSTRVYVFNYNSYAKFVLLIHFHKKKITNNYKSTTNKIRFDPIIIINVKYKA